MSENLGRWVTFDMSIYLYDLILIIIQFTFSYFVSFTISVLVDC